MEHLDIEADDINLLYEHKEIVSNGVYVTNNLDNLPGSMEIFAITMTSSLNTMFYIQNILDYYPLSFENINTIESKLKIRTIKKKISKTRISQKSVTIGPKSKRGSNDNNDKFFNQITIVMSIPIDYNSDISKDVNIKLFKNGSIQISGLKTINQCNITINKMIELLRGDYCVFFDLDSKPCTFDTPNATPNFIRFIESDKVKILNIKINMINTMFQYPSKINRSQLYIKLVNLKRNKTLASNIRLKYQPDIHAPVHVKIDLGNKKPVTAFVFESGKILIMAAKKRDNVVDAYNCIYKLLEENHEYIIKRNLLDIIANDSDLCKLIDLSALSQVVDDL
jgi:TATA-box binding protein (TBP) (component of TFIID and TFIIIB)